MRNMTYVTGVMALIILIVAGCSSSSDDEGQGNSIFTKGEGVTDRDGNKYKTVILGNQEWMAENLRTSKYANGDAIPEVSSQEDWANLTSAGWNWYNQDSNNDGSYGKLYNWYAINDGRNVCPTGWHVPSTSEWMTLMSYLDDQAAYSVGSTPVSQVAGGYLKEKGTEHWLSPNTGATNESGFTARGVGNRGFNGVYGNEGTYSFWWTSDEYNIDRAYLFSITYDNTDVILFHLYKRDAQSCRCIKN